MWQSLSWKGTKSLEIIEKGALFRKRKKYITWLFFFRQVWFAIEWRGIVSFKVSGGLNGDPDCKKKKSHKKEGI